MIIDLFAGAGGLSLGAARAGFQLASAVELDPFAMETHKKNFPNSVHLAEDVSTFTGARLLEMSGVAPSELTGLIGGPPCQGFSTIGRREVTDSRNNLFSHFFRLVDETRPAFFLAENVPGILDSQYDEIREAAFSQLDANVYNILPPISVQANLYGAPTTRTRIFFIGFNPLNFLENLQVTDFLPPANAIQTTVGVALQGLPTRIDCRWLSEEAGWKRFRTLEPGFFNDKVQGQVPNGVGDPIALERYFKSGEVSGCMGTKHSEAVKARYGALKFGRIDKISKSIRLDPEGFCPTLRAGTARDKGSYQAVRPIHPTSPRVITPREAARLQGFPDWFVFHRTKWHSFRQIGNSVSPIVSEFILSCIRAKLR